MTGEGYTLSDIAAVSGNRNGDGFGGGDWGAWIILFLLFGLFGNRGGFGGGFGGGGGCCERCATPSDLTAQGIVQKLDAQTYGLADSTYALNNSITGGFAGVQQTLCQGFNGVNVGMLQGFNGVQTQLAKCCCDIERGIDGVNYNLATQACDIKNTIQGTTRDIIENQNCNARAILDFLTQDKISTLQAENQSLKFQASQSAQNAFITANQDAQTAELIRRLGRDNPVPAYVVPNPNCCYNPFGFGFSGYGNNGCGCGCGGAF